METYRYFYIQKLKDREELYKIAKNFIVKHDEAPFDSIGLYGLNHINTIEDYSEDELNIYIQTLRNLVEITSTLNGDTEFFALELRDSLTEMILYVMKFKSTVPEQDTFIYNIVTKVLSPKGRLMGSWGFSDIARSCYNVLQKRTILVIKKIWRELNNERESLSRSLTITPTSETVILRINEISEKLADLNSFINVAIDNEIQPKYLDLWRSHFPEFFKADTSNSNKPLPVELEARIQEYLGKTDPVVSDRNESYYYSNVKPDEYLNDLTKEIDDMSIGTTCIIT